MEQYVGLDVSQQTTTTVLQNPTGLRVLSIKGIIRNFDAASLKQVL
jgi:hypothetical protein